jgi:hypothetical protein
VRAEMFLANGRKDERSDRQTDDTKKLTVALQNFAIGPEKLKYRLVTTKRPDYTCVVTSALIQFSLYIHVPNKTVMFRIP